jgi:putative amide transporter protein
MFLGLVLLFVGAVLLINGLGLLDLVDPRETAIMNIFTGVIAFLVCIHNAFAGGSDVQIQSCAYGLLFSFTYLWVAYDNLTKQDGRGFGWFSFFVSVTAVAIAWDQYTRSTTFWTHWLTVCWAAWAALWFSYFILGVYKNPNWIRPVAFLTIIEAVLTAWLPGYLILSGHMPT